MKKTLFILFFLFVTVLAAQTAKYPYPIIFLHGLASNDSTWLVTLTALGGNAKAYDACLNHDGDTMTASLTTTDVYPIGWRDGNTNPSPTRLYVMNYDNNNFAEAGHTTHKYSNQSAIMKQGVALKAMIQAVLDIENTDKVVLIGHSMGGLEIREYLQRGFDGTTGGRGTNWVDQTSSSGHRVARVVTTGTPHGGSNHTGGSLQFIPGVNEKCEAVRDLRYPYIKPGIPPVSVPAPYMFGGAENQFQWDPSPHHLDVNCNGVTTNTITGISSGTSYNASMPLPTNIRYTYITSNFSGTGQDGLVELTKMWLYSGSTPTPSSADTILLAINHLQQPMDVPSIIRGMDEPDDTTYAYAVPIGQATQCFITKKMNLAATDRDVFKVWATANGALTFSTMDIGSQVDSLIISTASGEVGRVGDTNGVASVFIANATQGTLYYATVRGTATDTSLQIPYTFLAASTNSPSTQASNISSSSVQETQFTFDWTDGDGDARAVFIKQGNTGSVMPDDSATYTGNTIFGSGDQVGSSGWYCVYNGTQHPGGIMVTGLTAGTDYRVMVCEYNGAGGNESYNSSPATGNPETITTSSTSALSGQVGVGETQTYASLTGTGGLFEAINTLGLSGNLIAHISSNLTEDGTHPLRQWTEYSGTGYTVTIMPDGNSERVISGYVDSLNGMVRFDGADRVTIDGSDDGEGRYLRFVNTYDGGNVLGVLNGVNNFAARNCTIEGNDSIGGEGKLIFIKATGTANDGITISDNIIRKSAGEFWNNIVGVSATGEAGISNVTIVRNEFINLCTGLWVDSTQGNHWLIHENSFYGTDSLRQLNAIEFNAAASSNDTISKNYIGGKAPVCGGSPLRILYNIKGIVFQTEAGNNNLIMNNTIQNIDGGNLNSDKRFKGIQFFSDGVIRGNIIGHPTDSAKGIIFDMDIASTFQAIRTNTDSTLNNTIANIYMYAESHLLQSKTLEAPATFIGITIIEDGSSPVVAGNKIYSIGVKDNSHSDMVLNGIEINSPASIVNNMISFTLKDTTVNVRECAGLSVLAHEGNVVNIFYNSVFLSGKVQAWNESYCLYRSLWDTSIVTLKNNIFHNEQYGPGNTAVIQTGWLQSFTSNYNDLYSTRPDSLCSFDNGASHVNFAGWKTATGQDAHSASIEAQFVNKALGDLHLTGSSLGNMSFAGIPLAGITTDIDGETRHLVRPYMGADENLAYPLSTQYTIVALAGAGGTITPPDTVIVLEGNNQQFIITPETGYDIDSLFIDGVQVDSTTSYTFINVTANHTIRAVFAVASVTVNYDMADKWNMVSIPLTLDNYTKTTIFPTAVSDAFAYEGSYQIKTILGNGIGYWLKFTGAQSVMMTGYPRTADTIAVSEGWNMIGTLSSPVLVSSIISLTPGLTLSQFFGYANGYTVADTLTPAKGYWVKSNINGQLVLLALSSTTSKGNIRIQQTGELPPSPPDVSTHDSSLPTHYSLEQNYPNPFNPTTVIQYSVPGSQYISLKIYNVLGKEVATLVDGMQDAGFKSQVWDASGMPSGIYYYQLTAVGQDGILSYKDVKRLLIMK